MIFCPKCGKELPDNAKFCDACGEKLPVPVAAPAPVAATPAVVPVETAPIAPETPVAPQMPSVVFCEQCGAKNDRANAFCESCGARLNKPETPAEKKSAFDLKAIPAILEKKGIPMKWVKLGGSALALILVVSIVLSLLGGHNEPNYALYLKDDEMFYSEISNWKPMQVTEDLTDGEDIGNSELANAASKLGIFAVMSEDGKTLFYADKAGDGATLYYRSVANAKKTPIKLAEDVSHYMVSKNGKMVVYLTEDGDLYQHNLKEKNKIDRDVSAFYASEDGKNIVYTIRDDDETNVYYKKGGKDKEKLVSDIGSLYTVDIDKSVLYYYKDDHFYKQKFGKDREKLVSDVHRIVRMYEDGSMYYLKASESSAVLFDYIEDDMAQVDANMEQPVRPTYPLYSDYGLDRYEEYQQAVNKYNEDMEVYWDAYNLYQDKVKRDNLREQLKNSETTQKSYTICYFDGKKETVLTENAEEYGQITATDAAVMIYRSHEGDEDEKIKLSEVSYTWEVQGMIESAIQTDTKTRLAVEAKTSALDCEDASNFRISSDGKTVYFVRHHSEAHTEGDLYKMAISGGKAKEAKMIEEDIYVSMITYVSDDNYLIFRDVEDSKGELYLGNKKLGDDVYLYNVRYTDGGKQVYFFTDWDDEDREGTLNINKNGKTKAVSDDVYSFVLTPDNQVLYLYDYNTDKYRGELYLYKGSRAKKVDEDVVAIVPVYTGKTTGYIY